MKTRTKYILCIDWCAGTGKTIDYIRLSCDDLVDALDWSDGYMAQHKGDIYMATIYSLETITRDKRTKTATYKPLMSNGGHNWYRHTARNCEYETERLTRSWTRPDETDDWITWSLMSPDEWAAICNNVC